MSKCGTHVIVYVSVRSGRIKEVRGERKVHIIA